MSFLEKKNAKNYTNQFDEKSDSKWPPEHICRYKCSSFTEIAKEIHCKPRESKSNKRCSNYVGQTKNHEEKHFDTLSVNAANDKDNYGKEQNKNNRNPERRKNPAPIPINEFGQFQCNKYNSQKTTEPNTATISRRITHFMPPYFFGTCRVRRICIHSPRWTAFLKSRKQFSSLICTSFTVTPS